MNRHLRKCDSPYGGQSTGGDFGKYTYIDNCARGNTQNCSVALRCEAKCYKYFCEASSDISLHEGAFKPSLPHSKWLNMRDNVDEAIPAPDAQQSIFTMYDSEGGGLPI